jgi:diacylglycerol kinase family enzyme
MSRSPQQATDPPRSAPTSRGAERLPQEMPEDFDAIAKAPKKRMLIIVNPYATTVSDRLRHLVVYALQGRYQLDAVDTEARGHAIEICKEAAHEGYDVVVAFGGDGTVNEAANGLRGSTTPLCCLPGGSANVFGKMLGIPGELVAATEHLLAMADEWRPRSVDLGLVNGRCFTFASGLGLDASVVERVDSNPHLKARYGPWFFTWAAISSFNRRYLVHPPRLALEANGRRLEGVTAVVQNGSPFTYFQNRPIELARGPKLDSGTLAAAVLHKATPVAMPFVAWRALSGKAEIVSHRQITGIDELTEMTVSTTDGRPLPLQVDGDFVGEVDEARYSMQPRALRVIS